VLTAGKALTDMQLPFSLYTPGSPASTRISRDKGYAKRVIFHPSGESENTKIGFSGVGWQSKYTLLNNTKKGCKMITDSV
jgi:hypothetical protein